MLRKLVNSKTRKASMNSNIRLRVIIISLIALLLGTILLLIYAFNENNAEWPSWLLLILQELASVLIISGALSVVSEYFLRGEFINEIRESEERLRRSTYTSESVKRLGEYGVMDCYHDSSVYNFSEFMKESENVVICLNDARSWLSSNINALTEHLRSVDSTTVLIVINPKSDYTKILADKINAKLPYLSEKIKDACQKCIETYERLESPKGSLTIYWHHLPVVNAIYFSDKRALVTPYTNSRPRAVVPLFVLTDSGKPSYYDFIKTDIEHLLSDSTTICVYKSNAGGKPEISPELNS
jgi:hypothetical protein